MHYPYQCYAALVRFANPPATAPTSAARLVPIGKVVRALPGTAQTDKATRERIIATRGRQITNLLLR